MKLRNITYYIMLAFLALQLISCDNKDSEDALFDTTATERINARSKELDDALKSSEYWKAVYYTDDTQMGGFTHLFKFNTDGTVDMASDFNDNSITRANSRYSIDLGSTVSLVFTTKNRIHLLSDSADSPTGELIGQGYKGDFQFLYYGQENGQIIFRTNRSGQELRFVKATAQDWLDLQTFRNMAKNLEKYIFRTLEINEGAAVRKFDFDLNGSARFATATSLDPGSNETKRISILYTTTGLTIRPAIEVGGQKLTNFIYDPVTENFVATGTGNVSAIIKYANVPGILTDDYKFLLPGNPQQILYYDPIDLSIAYTNSQLFKSLEKGVNAIRPLVVIVFYFNAGPAKENYIRYIVSNTTTGGIINYFYDVNVIENPVDKTITLQSIGWFPSGPGPAFLRDLNAELVDKPLYIKRESFRIIYGNPIYTIANGNGFRITNYLI